MSCRSRRRVDAAAGGRMVPTTTSRSHSRGSGSKRVLRPGAADASVTPQPGLEPGLEELAAERQLGRAVAVGEEAEVTDAMEAVRQGVQQEPPDELVRGKAHHLCLAPPAVVLPAEGDVGVRHRDQPGVGDRDPMGVAAKIGQHLGWAAEGRLGIDDPRDPAKPRSRSLKPADRRARRDRRRSQVPLPRTPCAARRESAGGRAARAPGPGGKNRAGSRSTGCRPATGRRPGRRNGHGGGGAGSGPRCGNPRMSWTRAPRSTLACVGGQPVGPRARYSDLDFPGACVGGVRSFEEVAMEVSASPLRGFGTRCG